MYGFRAEPATQIEILLFVIFKKAFVTMSHKQPLQQLMNIRILRKT